MSGISVYNCEMLQTGAENQSLILEYSHRMTGSKIGKEKKKME